MGKETWSFYRHLRCSQIQHRLEPTTAPRVPVTLETSSQGTFWADNMTTFRSWNAWPAVGTSVRLFEAKQIKAMKNALKLNFDIFRCQSPLNMLNHIQNYPDISSMRRVPKGILRDCISKSEVWGVPGVSIWFCISHYTHCARSPSAVWSCSQLPFCHFKTWGSERVSSGSMGSSTQQATEEIKQTMVQVIATWLAASRAIWELRNWSRDRWVKGLKLEDHIQKHAT